MEERALLGFSGLGLNDREVAHSSHCPNVRFGSEADIEHFHCPSGGLAAILASGCLTEGSDVTRHLACLTVRVATFPQVIVGPLISR